MKYLGPLYTPNKFLFSENGVPKGGYKSVKFVRIVDGDTAIFLVDQKEERVRFFVVNTKETFPNVEPFGEAAKVYTENMLKYAKTIYLQSDPESDLRDDTESKRLLAWVWVDYKLLNYLLVEKGYAEVRYISSKKLMYLQSLYDARKIAKNKKIRIYSGD